MMSKIPKKCITCLSMDFLDDDLDDMGCFHPLNMPNSVDPKKVDEDGYCDFYCVNKSVLEDAKQGCW